MAVDMGTAPSCLSTRMCHGVEVAICTVCGKECVGAPSPRSRIGVGPLPGPGPVNCLSALRVLIGLVLDTQTALNMNQTVSQTKASSPSDIQRIFDTALKSYLKKTKLDLKEHDLFKQLEKCDSPGAILAAFQADMASSSLTSGDEKLKKWFVPTVNVLYAFSGTLSQGVALVNLNP